MRYFCSIFLILWSVPAFAQEPAYLKEWQNVDFLQQIGQYRQMLDTIAVIQRQAIARRQPQQQLKSLLIRSKIRLVINEAATDSVFQDFEDFVAHTEMPTKALAQLYLGNLYLRYFNANQHVLLNRVYVPNEENRLAWDARMVLEKAHKHFQDALQNPDYLKRQNVRDYTELLSLQQNSQEESLFEVVYTTALQFYKQVNRAILFRETDSLFGETDYGVDMQAFLELPAPKSQQGAMIVKIYSALIEYYQSKKDDVGLGALEFNRLKYFDAAHLTQDLIRSTDVYLKSAQNFENLPIQIQFLTVAFQNLKTYAHQSLNTRHAAALRSIALCEYIRSLPHESNALTAECEAWVSYLNKPEFRFILPNVLIPRQENLVHVSYKSTTDVWVKCVKVSPEQWVTYRAKINRPSTVYNDVVLALEQLTHESTQQFHFKLPKQETFAAYTTEVAMPALDAGQYLFFVASDSLFSNKFGDGSASQAYTKESVTTFQVSNIAYYTYTGSQPVVAFVHRKTGRPLSNTTIDCENGRFFADGSGEWRPEMSCRGGWMNSGEEMLWGENIVNVYNEQENRTEHTTVQLLLDRTLYRPGQKVYFKGVLTKLKVHNDRELRWELLPNTAITVELKNAKREKIDELRLTTNEFGSVFGSFTLPQTVLTGRFSIGVERMQAAIFFVEEYKRPTFEVLFDTLKTAPKLNDVVQISGQVKAFSGAPISNANVAIEINRQRYYPYEYWRNTIYGEPALSNLSIVTDEQGRFKTALIVAPNTTGTDEANLNFRYQIQAKVQDSNGETQVGIQTFVVSYQPFNVITNWHEKVEIQSAPPLNIVAQTANGVIIPVKGTLSIYQYPTPTRVTHQRRAHQQSVEVFSMDDEMYATKFPNEPPPSDRQHEPKLIRIVEIDTHNLAEMDLGELEPGNYRFDVSVKDDGGNLVTYTQELQFFDKSSQRAMASPGYVLPIKVTVQPNEHAQILIGSGFDVRVKMVVNINQQIIEERAFRLNREQKIIDIPIYEKHRGGFIVYFMFYYDNRFYEFAQRIKVPYTNKQLQLSLETFRDKLLPGSLEEWKIAIKGNEGERVAAEVVAAMYDASLDALLSKKLSNYDWQDIANNIWKSRRGYYSENYENVYSGTDTELAAAQHLWRGKLYFPAFSPPDFNRSTLFWFGWSHFIELNLETYALFSPQIQSQIPPSTTLGAIGTFKGHVTDCFGDPATGANVFLEGIWRGASVDIEGDFIIRDIPNGEYLVKVSYVGCEVSYKRILIRGDTGAVAFFNLVEATNNNEQIEVLASVPINALSPSSMFAGEVTSLSSVQLGREDGRNGNQNIEFQEALQQVNARQNFNETAFFYPDLKTDPNGNIVFSFTVPESLTRWRFQAFAHTKDLSTGALEASVVTQKDFMVVSHAPRFLREGDEIVFKAKIMNQSAKIAHGTIQLQLLDPITENPLNQAFQLDAPSQNFHVDSKKEMAFEWKLRVPIGLSMVKYKVVALSADFSDGESSTLPIVSKRILVTESMPLVLSGNQAKTFDFEKLRTYTSNTFAHEALTVEFTPNPIWYAVQSLPYLVEFPHGCVEQTFARYFANRISKFILDKYPNIRNTFASWQQNDALTFWNKLEQNPELKSAFIEEIPWVFEGTNKATAQQHLALLFDTATMAEMDEIALQKIFDMQDELGGWGWFKGMGTNRWMTQYVLNGFGQLKQMGALPDNAQLNESLRKALAYLDHETLTAFQKIQTDTLYFESKEYPLDLHYLYTRSLYPIRQNQEEVRMMIDFWMEKIKGKWLGLSVYEQGMAGLILHRFGYAQDAKTIVRSLKDRSITTENGMYWTYPNGYYWYQSPVETHALLIEAFHEVLNDQESVEKMKTWLLLNKHKNHWGTTKSTVAALYALLMRGDDLVNQSQEVHIKLGNYEIKPQQSEVGTGYFKERIEGNQVVPEMGLIEAQKTGNSIAFGGVYWQYFEELDKISAAQTTLKIHKTWLKENRQNDKEEWVEVTEHTPLKVGDILKVRIVVQNRNPLEFVHLKDMRPATFEPMDVLSGYRRAEGLGYYQSTKDLATHFFIDYLPQGTYILEYQVKLSHSGHFSGGISTLQSMYAPEFSAQTEGASIVVQ